MLLGNRFHSLLMKCILYSSVDISYQQDGNLQQLLVASLLPCENLMCSSAAVEPWKSQHASYHWHSRICSSSNPIFLFKTSSHKVLPLENMIKAAIQVEIRWATSLSPLESKYDDMTSEQCLRCRMRLQEESGQCSDQFSVFLEG